LPAGSGDGSNAFQEQYKNMPETDITPVDNPRCVSGIEGLDDILAGGLPSNCFYLVQGDPGSGKTTLALQFLLEGVRHGEKVFYITLSETKAELLQVAHSHGWSLDDVPLLELSAIEAFTAARSSDHSLSSFGN
jgi:circadian clock protein KaiC